MGELFNPFLLICISSANIFQKIFGHKIFTKIVRALFGITGMNGLKCYNLLNSLLSVDLDIDGNLKLVNVTQKVMIKGKLCPFIHQVVMLERSRVGVSMEFKNLNFSLFAAGNNSYTQ